MVFVLRAPAAPSVTKSWKVMLLYFYCTLGWNGGQKIPLVLSEGDKPHLSKGEVSEVLL